MTKTGEFWKHVRAQLKENYDFTPNSPLTKTTCDKKGYQLFAFIQNVAFRFNELGVPPKLTLECSHYDMKFDPKNQIGIEKHAEIIHPDQPL